MTKEVFLSQLRDCMAAEKVDRANMEKYLRRFSKILDNTPPAGVSAKINEFGRPADIAARIAAIASKDAGESDVRVAKPSAPHKSSAPTPPVRRQQAPAAQPKPVEKKPVRDDDRVGTDEEGKKRFILLAALTSPLWILLVSVIGGLFLCAYTAIVLLAAALVIAEVVMIVGGVLVSVIGIVYGVMKILPGEAVYIGLYELGLGIRNGGIVLLISILVYNFVINVTPLAIKSLTRFAKFVGKSLWDLVLRIRKECDKT